MTRLTDTQIEKLEAKGFNRWTKGSYDRLYINPESFGLKVERYGTGNVAYAEFEGERISNSEGTRMLNGKYFIDIESGKLFMKTDAHRPSKIKEAIERIMTEVIDA